MITLDRKRLPTLAVSPDTLYERRLSRLAFLAPDLQASILEGRQPPYLNLEQLVERPLPIYWEAQRDLFWSAHPHAKLRNRTDANLSD